MELIRSDVGSSGTSPNTKFLPENEVVHAIVPPENDTTVEATWVAAWAYFSWVRIAQLALRRGRHYWRLHISEQWLTAQLANVLAIADPAADPADPVALVRLARAIMTQGGGDRPPRNLEGGVAICTSRGWIPLCV